MLLGMGTSSYHLAAGLEEWQPSHNPPMRLEHFLRKAAELSLAGVSISDPRLLERSDYGYLSGLRRQAEQAGLFLELTYRGLRSDHLQDAIRAAEALGCRQVTFVPRLERALNPEHQQVKLKEIARLLDEALPLAERYALVLALAGGSCLKAEELRQLYEAARQEWLALCLEPASPLFALEDFSDWVKTLAPQTVSVRLQDFFLKPADNGAELSGCPLGEGIVDFSPALELLGKPEKDGLFIIETPTQRLSLPFLEEEYLARWEPLRASQVARLARLMRARGREELLPLPQESSEDEDEILAAEEERFENSLEWLQTRWPVSPPSPLLEEPPSPPEEL
jgi:sugar phosphate isomerase/epimerase